ncbi:MAG TPA: hypothetical protein VMV97_09640 [Sulfuriferula sp.]|nr:hypothetical protein [Sulfuriferula sp.]
MNLFVALIKLPFAILQLAWSLLQLTLELTRISYHLGRLLVILLMTCGRWLRSVYYRWF